MGNARSSPALRSPTAGYLRRQLDQAEAEFACQRSNPRHVERELPTVGYLQRQLAQTEMEFACRSNPHHDQDGKFHDGSPESILAASQGRLRKAEDHHARTVEAYQDGDDLGYPDNEIAQNDMEEARDGHQAAIDAARGAGIAAQAAHRGPTCEASGID